MLHNSVPDYALRYAAVLIVIAFFFCHKFVLKRKFDAPEYFLYLKMGVYDFDTFLIGNDTTSRFFKI